MNFFDPKNERIDTRKEHLSPSGRYKLVVSKFQTKPGSWDYSQGKVYAIGSDEPIGTIQRNYGAFPFLFIEDHEGHDYLVGGENYQGQTVIQLDTGKKVNNLSHGHEKGFGFCWSSYEFNKQHKMLVVDGCYWACPYEIKLFDFSDPIGKGWVEIENKLGIDGDRRPVEFKDDGTIVCYQSTYTEDEEGEEIDGPIASTRTFKREGNELVLIEEWISEEEKERRRANEEARKAYDAKMKAYRSSDPLYLECQSLLKTTAGLNPEEYESVGITYKDWCPTFDKQEQRMCRRICKKSDGKHTIDLEWAAESGPIKLIIYKDGKHLEDKFFEDHSAEGMKAAFEYASNVVRAS